MPKPKAQKAPKSVEKKTAKPSSRKPKSKKEEATVAPETKTVTESVAETVDETTTESAVETKKKRHVPTKESVEQEFDELVTSIEEEIARLRESTAKSKGVKFLRTVNKKVKTLRAHTLRVTKQRKRTGRKNNSNSGFLKPVGISEELAKFTGWDPSKLRSRVDVTKFICAYIKEKKLQNPENGREIRVETDPKLQKLLKYDKKKDDKPLTYYSLQTYLKPHFKKDEPKKDEPEEKPAPEPTPEPVKAEEVEKPRKRKQRR
uniref:DM2 domain-containing protein n=1 Tax=viral metagenome TaxID=1070528 RepID=A0A6C0EK53_9ZZZZ